MRRLAVAYFLLQAFGTAAWWVFMFAQPAYSLLFWPITEFPQGLWAFFFPDVLILIVGSLVAAQGIERNKPWARAAVCLVAGGTIYAGMVTLVLALFVARGWLGAVVMLLPMIVPALIAWRMKD